MSTAFTIVIAHAKELVQLSTVRSLQNLSGQSNL